MKTVTLIDGRTVPSDSLEWRDECRRRHSHILELLGMHGADNRRQYLDQVDGREGAEAGNRLRERFTAIWKEMKA